VYGGPDNLLESLQLAPETDWKLAGPIVTRKAWPCCGSMHSSIDGVLQLKRDHGIGPDDVRTIVSRVPSRRFPHINRPRPSSGLEARFSAQYGMVVALRHGDVTVAAFGDLQLSDQCNLELLERVELKADPQLGSDDPDMRGSRDMGAIVEVVLFDGRSLSVTVDFPLGNPHNPLTSQALRKKFLQCAATSLEPAECEALWRALEAFEQGGAGVAARLLRLIAVGSSRETPLRGGGSTRAKSPDAPG
jgi:2-methylcitrate dehydratase PrpD